MSRRYDEPVEVRRRDDEPAEFLWRGRLWVVRAVLARWVETGAWWQAAKPPATATGTARTQGSAALAVTDSAVLTEADSAVLTEADSAVLSVERELWRVEATRGREHGTGVFELCFDWSSAAGTGWSLARALD